MQAPTGNEISNLMHKHSLSDSEVKLGGKASVGRRQSPPVCPQVAVARLDTCRYRLSRGGRGAAVLD